MVLFLILQDQEMMLDPEGSGGMRPVDPTQLLVQLNPEPDTTALKIPKWM